jgi:RNA polymerase sigma-70 factor (ECF subfamily)
VTQPRSCSTRTIPAGRLVRRLVGTDEDAHDIVAEAFARLLGRWSRVDNPHSYLYMIAANLVSDHWRKAGREQRAI